jgi:long-chain acyl-CoA synthetase
MSIDVSPSHPKRLVPADVLRERSMLILGGTGFLGKLFWLMLLDYYPTMHRIYLMVRGGKGRTPAERFWSEIATSEVFAPLRARLGEEAFRKLLQDKVVPLDGDVSKPNCGIPNIDELIGKIDVVINVAGVVDFNPPLDEAIDANAFGATNIVALCQTLQCKKLMHTSTCYVVGNRKGLVLEELPSVHPFPRAAELGKELWDPEREVADCLDIIKQAKSRCDDAFRQSEFREHAKRNLLARSEPTVGPAFDEELASVRRRWLADRLVEAGKDRASHWGWPNIYTYTKSIGEQLIARSGLEFTIARPACCESTRSFPFPGWNEGIGTSAPIIFLVMKGQHQITGGDVILDFIPTDVVCAGMVLTLLELLDGTHKPVYQYGASDVNPATSERFGEMIGLYKRKYFQRKGGNPFVNFLQAHFEPAVASDQRFSRFGPRRVAEASRGLAKALRYLPGPAAGVGKQAARSLESIAKQEERIHGIIELFGPFTNEQKGPFSCANSRVAFDRLAPEDQAKLRWDPEQIDWRDYWMNQHMPAMEKRVIPWLDERYKRETKPLKRHQTLPSLVLQMTERHGDAVAFQRLEGTGLSGYTFNDVDDLTLLVACNLHARGVRHGTRVVLSAKNHPLWPIAYFGIVRAGGIAVPVDSGIEAEQMQNIARESEASIALFDSFTIEAFKTVTGPTVVSLQEIANAGVRLSRDERQGLSERASALPQVHDEDVASLIFTSGTTGKPKGVQLTHKNFTAMIAALAPLFPLTASDRCLSVLPLHHTFEFSCGMLLPFSRGTRVVYLDELNGDNLRRGLREARVTSMVGVPAVWQLLERRILSQVAARGTVAEFGFARARDLSQIALKTTGVRLGKLLFGQVHEELGGNIRTLISGGAALPRETQELFASLGLSLSEGYGLTEAAPVLAVNKESRRAGTVGKAVPGVELKIDSPDPTGVGEVLARGPNVMKGYTFEEATREVLDGEWLRTGDLGKFDKRGDLVIVGRAKDVVVTASGENIYPDDLERVLGDIAHVEEYAFVGIPLVSGGERLACLWVPKVTDVPRATRLEQAERSFRTALGKLPYGKQPGLVQMYEGKLPRTGTRKVKRREVRAILDRILSARGKPSVVGEAQKSPVRQAIAAVKGKPLEEIHATSTLIGDLGFDSLSLSELLAALETQFGSVDAEALQQCITVGEVEKLVQIAAPPSERPRLEPSRYAIQGGGRPQLGENLLSTKLPSPIQEAGKRLIGNLQDVFYNNIMSSRVHGSAHIPHNRNVIVVANHTSHLDMGFVRHALGKYGEDLVSLAAQDYFFDKQSWKRAFFENFSNLKAFDRRGGLRASERQAAEVISEGRTLLIFPEGTRSTDGQLTEFKALVGHLALYYNVDILPVYIHGAHAAMPKGSKLPKARELEAFIGPPFAVSDMRRLTEGMKLSDASREIARLCYQAVLGLRDGKPIDFKSLTIETAKAPENVVHPLVQLFGELQQKFDPKTVKSPVSFYFTLGDDAFSKWSVKVTSDRCEIKQGKPETGTADCVLKTNPEMFRKIVQDAFVPGPTDFLSGAIKSNDVSLLLEFQRVFRLSETGGVAE